MPIGFCRQLITLDLNLIMNKTELKKCIKCGCDLDHGQRHVLYRASENGVRHEIIGARCLNCQRKIWSALWGSYHPPIIDTGGLDAG